MISVNASDLHRILACLGSVALCEPIPRDIEDESEAAREGTAAHEAAECLLSGRDPPAVAKNGVTIDAAMVEHAKAYADVVFNTARGQRPLIEKRYDFLASPGVEVRVKIDAASPSHDELDVFDFKYGWRSVEAEGNPQTLAGGIGVIRAASELSRYAPSVVRLHVYQPRPYHPLGALRTWTLSFADMVRAKDQLCAELAKLETPEPLHTYTGPQCNNCRAAMAGQCNAHIQAAYNAVDVTYRGGAADFPDDALPAELQTLQRAQEVIKQRVEFLEDIATRKIRAGVVLPGWGLKPRKGNTRWTKTIAELRQLTNVPLVDEKLVTPAEAVRRGMSEELMKEHTDRPDLSPTLARIDADKFVKGMLKK